MIVSKQMHTYHFVLSDLCPPTSITRNFCFFTLKCISVDPEVFSRTCKMSLTVGTYSLLQILFALSRKYLEKNRNQEASYFPSYKKRYKRQITLSILGYHFSSRLTATLHLCPIYLKSQTSCVCALIVWLVLM